MPYDHSTKIGNQGDLVKHPVLFACFKHLLTQTPNGRFEYAETHSGRPEYVLPEGGEWRRGIGAFATSDDVSRDRTKRRDGQASELGDVGEFDELFLGRELSTGMKYLGSSGIAFQYLCKSKWDFSMCLYDTDQAVVEDLIRYFRPWERVIVEKRDGYTAVGALDYANFVLIDPPRLDTDNVVKLIEVLIERNTPFLAWVPRTSHSSQMKGGNGVEAKTSKGFKQKSELAGAKVIGVQWSGWGPFPGCWLAVSCNLEHAARNAVKKVVDVMKTQKTQWKVAD